MKENNVKVCHYLKWESTDGEEYEKGSLVYCIAQYKGKMANPECTNIKIYFIGRNGNGDHIDITAEVDNAINQQIESKISGYKLSGKDYSLTFTKEK